MNKENKINLLRERVIESCEELDEDKLLDTCIDGLICEKCPIRYECDFNEGSCTSNLSKWLNDDKVEVFELCLNDVYIGSVLVINNKIKEHTNRLIDMLEIIKNKYYMYSTNDIMIQRKDLIKRI